LARTHFLSFGGRESGRPGLLVPLLAALLVLVATRIPAGGIQGTFLALATALVSVGVLWRQFVPPLAVRLELVEGDVVSRLVIRLNGEAFPGLRREALHGSLRVLGRQGHGFPVRRVLAGAVPARVTATAFRVPVMARVIHYLAGLKRTNEFFEAVAMRRHRVALAVRNLPVVLLAAVGGPRPALIGAALVNEGEVPLKPRHVPAKGTSKHTRLPEFAVMPLAQPLGLSWLFALAACSPDALVAWLKRIPVLHEPLVVSDTQSPDVRRSLAVLAIRHSTILAPPAYEGVVPRHVI
jgi:hypothetical protein